MDFEKILQVNTSRLALYQQLFLYGDFTSLDFKIDCHQLTEELKEFENSWIPYNIERGDTGRKGLSLTSLDGGMSGYPDMQSLYQYTKETGHKVSENDFNKPTIFFKKSLALKKIVDVFGPFLGRSRLIEFRAGGRFPPHRDQSVSFQVPDYFRLFAPLANCDRDGLFFIYDNKKIEFEVGRVYLFNAAKIHTVFAMQEKALTLALSLRLDQEAVAKTIQNFEIK